jgi:DNA-binding NtrC family response regulator
MPLIVTSRGLVMASALTKPSEVKLSQPHVLIVDDEAVVRHLCRDIAEASGMSVQTASTTEDALDFLAQEDVDLVVTDIRIPEIGGMELVRRIRATRPEVGIVVLTGYGSIEMAVEAMYSGVSDYITKPFTVESFEEKLKNVARVAECNRGRKVLRDTLATPGQRLIGQSPRIDQIRRQIVKVGNHDYPVLILGETGTGKEVVARAIHFSGSRANSPFVPVDCAALTPALIESELFGHEEGAFTGATRSKKGLIEAAHTGTLFLDEIGELSRELQSKLLRVLQEKEVRRVGATTRTAVNVRVIAATNRDLKSEAQEGTFRQDLYFRLSVVNIDLPPLRERLADLPVLVSAFLEKYQDQSRQITCISPGVWPKLSGHDWPGNVRELENVIESALALGSGGILREEDLVLGNSMPEVRPIHADVVLSLDAVERSTILRALRETNGDRTLAAKLLGIGKTTLYRKLNQYESHG